MAGDFIVTCEDRKSPQGLSRGGIVFGTSRTHQTLSSFFCESPFFFISLFKAIKKGPHKMMNSTKNPKTYKISKFFGSGKNINDSMHAEK